MKIIMIVYILKEGNISMIFYFLINNYIFGEFVLINIYNNDMQCNELYDWKYIFCICMFEGIFYYNQSFYCSAQ